MKNIQTFEEYCLNENIIDSINQYLFILEADDNILNSILSKNLNEASNKEDDNKINQFIKKSGLRFKKEGPGLLQYLGMAGKGIAKLIVAAMRKDKEGVKKIMKSVTKEQIIDILLKMDEISLHLITAPIYFIEATTGWILWADFKKRKIQDNVAFPTEIKRKIQYLKSQLRKLVDSSKFKMHKNNLTKLEKDIKNI